MAGTRIKRRITLVTLMHWLYSLSFAGIYFVSFWIDKMEKPFLFLAGITFASWVPYNACPLTVWENRLREKLNLRTKRFFAFTEIIFSFLTRHFGISRIPPYGTLYLIGILVIIKFLI